VIFANARISDRSFARFERWRFAIDRLFSQALESATLFLAQSRQDAQRLIEMGAGEDQLAITGNLKYDQGAPPVGKFAEWLAAEVRAQERWPVLIAGSVLAAEEEAVLAAYDIVQRKFRRALLVLAPRKPDRFLLAAESAAAVGWKSVKRSTLDLRGALAEDADVLVLDSIGELGGVYSLADAVFVGGSLIPAGGHNILEPACFAKPPVFGPSMENFSEMAAQFLKRRAGVQVATGPQLGKVWLELIDNTELNGRMGQAALELTLQNRGATEAMVERILTVLDGTGAKA
jgi:3-deoxy-D-manno-octulosonic-acid transferase